MEEGGISGNSVLSGDRTGQEKFFFFDPPPGVHGTAQFIIHYQSTFRAPRVLLNESICFGDLLMASLGITALVYQRPCKKLLNSELWRLFSSRFLCLLDTHF